MSHDPMYAANLELGVCRNCQAMVLTLSPKAGPHDGEKMTFHVERKEMLGLAVFLIEESRLAGKLGELFQAWSEEMKRCDES